MAKIKLRSKPKPTPPAPTALTPTLAHPQAPPPPKHPKTQEHFANTRSVPAISNAQIPTSTAPVTEGSSNEAHSPSPPEADLSLTSITPAANANTTTVSHSRKMTLLEIDEAIPIMEAAFDKANIKRADILELCTRIKELIERVKEAEKGVARDRGMSDMQLSMGMSMNGSIENSRDLGIQSSDSYADIAMGMVTRRQLRVKSKGEEVSKKKPSKGKQNKSGKGRRAPKKVLGGGREKSLGLEVPKKSSMEGHEDEEQGKLMKGLEALYRDVNEEVKDVSEKLAVFEKEVDGGDEGEIEIWARRIMERLELELVAYPRDRDDGVKDEFGS